MYWTQRQANAYPATPRVRSMVSLAKIQPADGPDLGRGIVAVAALPQEANQ